MSIDVCAIDISTTDDVNLNAAINNPVVETQQIRIVNDKEDVSIDAHQVLDDAPTQEEHPLATATTVATAPQHAATLSGILALVTGASDITSAPRTNVDAVDDAVLEEQQKDDNNNTHVVVITTDPARNGRTTTPMLPASSQITLLWSHS